jgi:hypothetical protein
MFPVSAPCLSTKRQTTKFMAADYQILVERPAACRSVACELHYRELAPDHIVCRDCPLCRIAEQPVDSGMSKSKPSSMILSMLVYLGLRKSSCVESVFRG